MSGEVLSGSTAHRKDGVRLDSSAFGFWGGRVFSNPHAPSNRQFQPATSYRLHENLKKSEYEQRIRDIEHSSFTPLVLSVTGGLGHLANTMYNVCLASML